MVYWGVARGWAGCRLVLGSRETRGLQMNQAWIEEGAGCLRAPDGSHRCRWWNRDAGHCLVGFGAQGGLERKRMDTGSCCQWRMGREEQAINFWLSPLSTSYTAKHPTCLMSPTLLPTPLQGRGEPRVRMRGLRSRCIWRRKPWLGILNPYLICLEAYDLSRWGAASRPSEGICGEQRQCLGNKGL